MVNESKFNILDTYQQNIINEFPAIEKLLIINMLFNEDIIKTVIESNLKPSDFQSFKAGLIYKGIIDLVEQKLDLNQENLKEVMSRTKLHSSNSLEILGSGSIIDALYGIPDVEKDFNFNINCKSIIKKIKNSGLKSRISNISLNLIKKLKNVRSTPVDTIKQAINEYITQIDNFESSIDEDDKNNIHSHLKTVSKNIKFKNEEKKRFFGIDLGYPILSNYLDGLQNEIYAIAGPSASGKTSFMTQLAYQIATLNDNSTILFFSMDQNVIDITAKLIAIHGKIPVDYAKNPLIKDIKIDKARREAMNFISNLKDRFYIFDQNNGGISLDFVQETVNEFRENPTENIVVFIDPIFSLEIQDDKSKNDFLWSVLKRFKTICHSSKISIVFSINTSCQSELRRPEKKDLFEYSSIFHDPYAIFLLYTEYSINPTTPFLEYEWDSSDVMIPVTELNIIKNKMKDCTGRIFFKYYNSSSSFKECVELENDNYEAMILNIEEYQAKQKKDKPKF